MKIRVLTTPVRNIRNKTILDKKLVKRVDLEWGDILNVFDNLKIRISIIRAMDLFERRYRLIINGHGYEVLYVQAR